MPGARLTVEQRRTIERCYRIGLCLEQIASIIGKHKSTVSRELARSFSAPGSRSPLRRTARGNGHGYRRVYDAERAQRYAAIKARRPKPRRLDHGPLREAVWELLRADWSPEQIAHELPGLYPGDRRMRVSHETIYQSLFIQTKGELKRELTAHLRSRRQSRKPHGGGAKRVTLGITDEIRISARPAEITRISLTGMIATLPLELRKSITWDRGTNENTNGLLRQYWPEGADLHHLTQTECDDVALRLNTRPRKTLDWQTPGQALNTGLVATAS